MKLLDVIARYNQLKDFSAIDRVKRRLQGDSHWRLALQEAGE